jgi:hypothetical protein
MIAAKLVQRRLLQQSLTQLLGFRIAGGEILSVNFTPRADEGVSVFPADFAILVAVAIVETCLAHAAIRSARRQHPPVGAKWQLTRARNHAVRALHRFSMAATMGYTDRRESGD